MNEGLKTSETQLRALQSRGSDRDWEAFYRKYGAVILSFCRRQGLDDFSARDVLQESMILLMRKLPGFTYSADRGRFRNWLLTLVHGKIRDARRRAVRRAELPLPGDSFSLRETSSAAELGNPDEGEAGDAWKQALIEEALRRLRQNPRIKPETIAIFEACVLQDMPVPEVALKFQLQENNIYQIKNRLLRKIREEVEHLEENQPGGPAVCSSDEPS